jgi:hypothetical protein
MRVPMRALSTLAAKWESMAADEFFAHASPGGSDNNSEVARKLSATMHAGAAFVGVKLELGPTFAWVVVVTALKQRASLKETSAPTLTPPTATTADVRAHVRALV